MHADGEDSANDDSHSDEAYDDRVHRSVGVWGAGLEARRGMYVKLPESFWEPRVVEVACKITVSLSSSAEMI